MSDIRNFINMSKLYSNYTLLEATAQELAQQLHDAGAGKFLGTDEQAIYDILDGIEDTEEFNAVASEYKDMFDDANLVSDLNNEMSGNDLAVLKSKLDRLGAIEFPQFAPDTPATSQPAEPAAAPAAPASPTTSEPAAPPVTPTEPVTPTPTAPTAPTAPEPDAVPAAPASPPAPEPDAPTDSTPRITAEIQKELEARGLDKGLIGEPLTPEDIAALEQPVSAPAAEPETPAAEPETPANAGSVLGRQLDVTTPNLMKAYNDGGKQSMPAVTSLQTALSRLGFDPNGIDGKYGPGTFKAVQNFQKANNLTVDGQAGPNTMKAIKAKLDSEFAASQTPAATQQNSSKEYNMKKAITESVELDECGEMPGMSRNEGTPVSMNVTLNASGEEHVQDLIRMMQLAGAPQSAPVADMHKGPSDDHDGMMHMMKLASEKETPAIEQESDLEEWDNTPEEEYKDHNYMDQDLAGGINRPKKQYAKAQDGDNAMAVEAIKADLRNALEEALKGK